MPLFSKSPPFDPARIDWLFDSFAWLLSNYGGHESFLRTYHLVLHSQKDFPISNAGHPRYEKSVLQAVMKHMGMGDWAINLVQMSEADDMEFEADTSDLSMNYSADGTAGFFSLDNYGKATIGYSDDLLHDFESLVATLSHEAAHYLLTKSITEMPGGWKNLEPITDLTAIFTGFGIFQCNKASVIQHSQAGVSSQLSGYLPESGRAYALAIFSELSMLDNKFVAKQLRPNPRSLYKAAIKQIQAEKADAMAELEQLVPLRSW